jgi:hypothetical protein
MSVLVLLALTPLGLLAVMGMSWLEEHLLPPPGTRPARPDPAAAGEEPLIAPGPAAISAIVATTRLAQDFVYPDTARRGRALGPKDAGNHGERSSPAAIYPA